MIRKQQNMQAHVEGGMGAETEHGDGSKWNGSCSLWKRRRRWSRKTGVGV